MTDDETPIVSEDAFHAELQSLLLRAHTGGVDVKGGWDCRNSPEHPDWEMLVTEVVKPDAQQ